MILLESGPARVDRYYWAVVGLFFLGMVGYFFYDGAVGYRNQNIAEAQNELARVTTTPVALGERPDEEDFERVRDGKVATREEVHAILGQPLTPRPGVPSQGVEVFASVYGFATVPIDAMGRVRHGQAGWQWVSWHHDKKAMRDQFFWGIAALVPALYVLYRAFRAARLRATIDEEGMTYGRTRIAFADIVSIRDYNRKGWVDLYYRCGDKEIRLRIDNQKIAKFDEIVELLCERKGFPNPVKEYAEAQRGRAADEEAASGSEVEVNVNVDVKTGGQEEPDSKA
jgi:hypothetical protein